MTDTPPPPGDDAARRSRRLRGIPVTAVLVAAIVTLVVLVAVKGRAADGGESAVASASTTPSASPSAPLTEPPDHGTVRVVDSGFENIRDVAGERQVTWGAVLANTSHAATASVALMLTYRDAHGKGIEVAGHDRRVGVPIIGPGRRGGIGGVAYLDSRVSTLKIRVERVVWSPVPADAKREALTTSHITTAWREKGESVPYWGSGKIGAYQNKRGNLHVMFRVDSTYATVLTRPDISMIFRNAHGDIIGGATIDIIGTDDELPPGWSDHDCRVKYGPPGDVAEAKTEVYVYPQPAL